MESKQKTPIALAIDLANENPQGQRPNWWWKQKLEELKQKEREMFEGAIKTYTIFKPSIMFDKNLTQE